MQSGDLLKLACTDDLIYTLAVCSNYSIITKNRTKSTQHILFCLFFTCLFSFLRFRDFQIGAFCPWQTEETTSLKPWQLDLSLLGCSRCVWQRQLCSDAAQCAKLLLLCHIVYKLRGFQVMVSIVFFLMFTIIWEEIGFNISYVHQIWLQVFYLHHVVCQWQYLGWKFFVFDYICSVLDWDHPELGREVFWFQSW